MNVKVHRTHNGYYIEVIDGEKHLYVAKVFKNKMMLSREFAHAKIWKDRKIVKGHCKDIEEGRTTR